MKKIGTKLLNIWRSYKILYSDELLCYFDLYVVKENDWWENISYHVYNTVEYWWVIAMFNRAENPFEALVPGEKIYILKQEYLQIVLNDLKKIREL